MAWPFVIVGLGWGLLALRWLIDRIGYGRSWVLVFSQTSWWIPVGVVLGVMIWVRLVRVALELF